MTYERGRGVGNQGSSDILTRPISRLYDRRAHSGKTDMAVPGWWCGKVRTLMLDVYCMDVLQLHLSAPCLGGGRQDDLQSLAVPPAHRLWVQFSQASFREPTDDEFRRHFEI
ncbi:hypothetical protein E2C01_076939 [Portunus trituberculatus]|uniref:Uncharacterized protein n=1 Tax=Portunus trituberculatus TaxID=210409 RepID=A0A5B7IEG6_PORTR|nr:hypothetical protein [Portunus trituberculatus]